MIIKPVELTITRNQSKNVGGSHFVLATDEELKKWTTNSSN